MNKKYITAKVDNVDKKKFDGYYNYENKPIGDGNPYYCCSDCGISDPQINGNLLNHSETCEYRIEELKKIGFN